MLSTLGKLFHISQWKPKARERGLVFAMISGPLALILVVLMLLNTARILAHLPKPVDTYKAITEVTRVQNYARNSLLLWLAGRARLRWHSWRDHQLRSQSNCQRCLSRSVR